MQGESAPRSFTAHETFYRTRRNEKSEQRDFNVKPPKFSSKIKYLYFTVLENWYSFKLKWAEGKSIPVGFKSKTEEKGKRNTAI